MEHLYLKEITWKHGHKMDLPKRGYRIALGGAKLNDAGSSFALHEASF